MVMSTAMVVSMSSNMISLVARSASFGLDRHTGCLCDCHGVPDGMNSSFALLGLFGLVKDLETVNHVLEADVTRAFDVQIATGEDVPH